MKPAHELKAAPPAKAAREAKGAAKASPGEVAKGSPGEVAKGSPGEPKGAAALGAVPLEEPARAAAARLDLGPAGDEGPGGEDVPWSYGQDRVTAMAVDPETLYAYWEVTDPAIERARAGLGAGGEAAWLNLRVYDTSGILFDGTNAHSYFDHGLARWDRQWFFGIGKPSSAAVVEVGMKSPEGYFVRIARSGRVDFPRSEPAPAREPEWITVLAGGEALPAGRGAPARPAGGQGQGQGQQGQGQGDDAWPAEPAGNGAAPHGGPVRFEQVPLWLLFEGGGEGERRWRELLGEGFERVEWRSESGESWFEVQGRLDWQGEPVISSWEAGPFSYPVHVDPPTRASWKGGSVAFTAGGVTHVVYGPWKVEIRNLGARSERAVLGRWEIYRSWTTRGGRGRPGRARRRARRAAPRSASPPAPGWAAARAGWRARASSGGWARARCAWAVPASGCSQGASERRLGRGQRTPDGRGERVAPRRGEREAARGRERAAARRRQRAPDGRGEREAAGWCQRGTPGRRQRAAAGRRQRTRTRADGQDGQGRRRRTDEEG